MSTDEQKNAEIAKALGYEWTLGFWACRHDGLLDPKTGLVGTPDCPPKFGTDPAAALGLVEAMRENGWAWESTSAAKGGWFAFWMAGTSKNKRYGSTLPQAIRDAAHAALCGEKT